MRELRNGLGARISGWILDKELIFWVLLRNSKSLLTPDVNWNV